LIVETFLLYSRIDWKVGFYIPLAALKLHWIGSKSFRWTRTDAVLNLLRVVDWNSRIYPEFAVELQLNMRWNSTGSALKPLEPKQLNPQFRLAIGVGFATGLLRE